MGRGVTSVLIYSPSLPKQQRQPQGKASSPKFDYEDPSWKRCGDSIGYKPNECASFHQFLNNPKEQSSSSGWWGRRWTWTSTSRGHRNWSGRTTIFFKKSWWSRKEQSFIVFINASRHFSDYSWEDRWPKRCPNWALQEAYNHPGPNHLAHSQVW